MRKLQIRQIHRPKTLFNLVLMLFLMVVLQCGSLAAVLNVGGGGYATVKAALAAANDYDTIRIASGTYTEVAPILVDGLTGVTIEATPGAAVRIRSTGPTSGEKLLVVSNSTDIALRGDSPANPLILEGQGNLVILANEHPANHNLVVTNVQFTGSAGAVAAVSNNRRATFNHCRWQNSGNGLLTQGNEDVELNDCEFYLANGAISIHTLVSSPGRTMFARCTIRGNDGSGGASPVGAFAMNGPNAGELIATACRFENFMWVLSGQFISGSNKLITLIDPELAAGQWGIASISSGFSLNVESSDPANKVDLRAGATIGTVRIQNGSARFTDCLLGVGGSGETIRIEPNVAVNNPVTIELTRCLFENGARIINDNSLGGSGSITYRATNSIFKSGAAGFLQTTNPIQETVELIHCTIMPGLGAMSTEMMRSSANDILVGHYSIFDGSRQAAINSSIGLAGTRNLIHSADETDFGGGTPADTLHGDPQLTADGHIAVTSPAIDAAIGSTEAFDFDRQARPVGASNDIGADELGGGGGNESQMKINLAIEVDKQQVGVGNSVAVTALATLESGEPAADCVVLPYVNGKRWGAFGRADQTGRAIFHIPLPNVGLQNVQLEARPAEEQWIWAPRVFDNQTVYLQGRFDLPAGAETGRMWLAADDSAIVFINGQHVTTIVGHGYHEPMEIGEYLLPGGSNTVSIRATNSASVAGVLMRMEIETETGKKVVLSDTRWRAYYDTLPPGWPNAVPLPGHQAITLGTAEAPPWNVSPNSNWPVEPDRGARFAGYRIPASGNFSNPIEIQVHSRPQELIPADPNHLIGAQYCTLFGPLNPAFQWHTAQAVPLVGYYNASNPDVVRQHLLWLAESGVDFLVIDWVGMAFDLDDWDNRTAATNEIIDSTVNVLDVMAAMRDEGMTVPKMVILAGICNGPCAQVSVVNQELTWIHQNLVQNPNYTESFLNYLGKPLLLVFGGQSNLSSLDATHFTLRMYSHQHQITNEHLQGSWSWMNGTTDPLVTMYQGQPEAMTASIGLFAGGGWTAAGALGRRNGATMLECFKGVLQYRPRFTQLHQFQEFAGQYEGSGYNDPNDVYGDSYNIELSDDFEPVSLSTPGYRGNGGGWGFLDLNRTRALVDLYRQTTAETTVMVVSSPLRGDLILGNQVNVKWDAVGVTPGGYTITVNGRVMATGVQAKQITIPLADFADGSITVRVTGEGTLSRYPPLSTEAALPLAEMIPAYAEVEFYKNIRREPSTAATDWEHY